MAKSDKQMAKSDKQPKEKIEEKKIRPEISEERLVRILGKDIPGSKKILVGLIRIKGISWSFANSICKKLGIDKKKKIEELNEVEIKKISEFVKNPDIPSFLKNRRKDFDSGEDNHIHGSGLDLRKDFDIKRLRKIKSYRGIRHAIGLPTRGQRTKSHFRRNRKKSGAVGVKGKSKK